MSKPLVSIVVPVFNDEDYIERALISCINQNLKNIEIICVDDASTDSTVDIIKRYAKKDRRIKLVEHSENKSALQARRTGLKLAKGDHILFLDGDDELSVQLAQASYKKAISEKADVVGFGVKVVRPNGVRVRKFEESLDPIQRELWHINIIRNVFRSGSPAQGSIYRFLFEKKLLLKAYRHIPEDMRSYRANDIMISFVALSYARHYVPLTERLYTYYLGIGGSGQANIELDKFKFYAQAISSVESISRVINSKNFNTKDIEIVTTSYQSARLFIISRVLRYCIDSLLPAQQAKGFDHLLSMVTAQDMIISATTFYPEALEHFNKHIPIGKKNKPSKNVMLYTQNIATGGLQAVVISQARYLTQAGYKVIIVVHSDESAYSVPDGATLEILSSGAPHIKMASFVRILSQYDITYVINHNVLYNKTWPFYAALARIQGVKTLGWMHSFALRSAHDLNGQGLFLGKYIYLLDSVIVLSKTDVSYWKILGHHNVYYLPNPPSPLLIDYPLIAKPKDPPKEIIQLVWYGRLNQQTKRLYSLIEVAMRLYEIDSNFHLTIIGPDGVDLSGDRLRDHVHRVGLENKISVVGAKHGNELAEEIKGSDIFLLTSDIEGYPLVITEVQSYGTPAVIYELPWLAVAEDNKGLVQIEQGNARAMAREIYQIARDKRRYKDMSKGSIEAAKNYLEHDFSKLYDQLLQDKLPSKYSPEPSVADMKMIIQWYNLYTEKNYKETAKRLNRVKERGSQKLTTLQSSLSYRLGVSITRPFRWLKQFIG